MTKGYRIVAAVIPIDDDQPSAASPFSQPWRRIMFLENQVSVDEMQRDGTDVVERECKRLGKKLASSVRKIGGALPW
ncbi:MAG: hypothetical protein U1F37_15225 [Alphaproteobacteria bacterium]|jgi:hypothetical protein